jgi:hypothetical protein
MPPDTPDDTGRWLTYAEFASLRGIARESAVRMAQRNHWRRRRNNRGEALVMVPEDALPPDSTGRSPGDNAGGLPGDREDASPDIAAGALAALEDVITLLREQLGQANGRADRIEAAAATDRERAEAAIAGERQRADVLRDRIEALQRDLDMARAQATTAHDALRTQRQAEEERRARGLLARLRAAVRGR